jgi:metal-responsive CopG/Arc/MetJ family transcriptional regulator
MKRIYVKLDEKAAEKFQKIKEHLGLKNDTEVLRALITDFYKKHQKELKKS